MVGTARSAVRTPQRGIPTIKKSQFIFILSPQRPILPPHRRCKICFLAYRRLKQLNNSPISGRSTTKWRFLTIFFVKSALEPVDSTVEPADSTVEPADSTVEPADSTVEPADSTVEPADSTVEPADSALEPVDSALEPVDSALEPADSALEPADSAIEPADSAIEPVDSTVEPVDSVSDFTLSKANFGCFRPKKDANPSPRPSPPGRGRIVSAVLEHSRDGVDRAGRDKV